MSLWDWVLLIGAALTLMGPFISGLYAALSRGLGVWAGLAFGYRRFHRKAMFMTVIFGPVLACLAIVVAAAALPAVLAYWVGGATGLVILCGVVGFLIGTAIALCSAGRIAGWIIEQIPHNDQMPCPVCFLYRQNSDVAPCPECAEPAPTHRCNECGCERAPGEIWPCPVCSEAPFCSRCGYEVTGLREARCPECGEVRA